MTAAEFARALIERKGANLDPKIVVYINRLLLRIYSVPALMTYLADTAVVPDGDGAEDGSVCIQLDFLRLPDIVIPQLERLIAAPHKLKYFNYVKNGSARIGVKIRISPSDLDGDAYEYAF